MARHRAPRKAIADAVERLLTGHEKTTLANGLSVAAERFREHALAGAVLAAFTGSREGAFLAEQFHRQAVDTYALLGALEIDA